MLEVQRWWWRRRSRDLLLGFGPGLVAVDWVEGGDRLREFLPGEIVIRWFQLVDPQWVMGLIVCQLFRGLKNFQGEVEQDLKLCH